eukprot:SAG11_NODE_26854_length_340_cov_0.576763_1_plen_41_part_01
MISARLYGRTQNTECYSMILRLIFCALALLPRARVTGNGII